MTESVVTVCLTLIAAAVVLHGMGQVFWCRCGRPDIASWDIWTQHNSQHLLDPYTFTHVLHGVLLCGLLWLMRGRSSTAVRFALATILEAAWELLENSPLVIDRYRKSTISADYYGDSIANSLTDILACCAGFLIASRLGLRWSVVFFVAIELALLVLVRDNLTLNVLMLVYPIRAILNWQLSASIG